MKNNIVFVKEFEAPAINEKEVLRYFGAKEWTKETKKIFEECMVECEGKISYKTCFLKLSYNTFESQLAFKSENLNKNLNGCKEIVVFGATLGTGLDFLIGKYGRISPVKGLMFQALGAERIESLCDELCTYLSKETGGLRPRFSPGYGDFSLENQKNIFKLLDCARKIGLTLNESLLMSPTKSVTAVAGVSKGCMPKTNCEICLKTDCAFRR